MKTYRSLSSTKTYEAANDLIGVGYNKEIHKVLGEEFVIVRYRSISKSELTERWNYLESARNSLSIHQSIGLQYIHFPIDLVSSDDEEIAFVFPYYPSRFFFRYGLNNSDFINSNRKIEKKVSWFRLYAQRALDEREIPDFKEKIGVCLSLAKAVDLLHQMKIVHTDISSNSILVDFESNEVLITSLDIFSVDNLFPPQVIGTPGFIAPEVIMNQAQPSRETDLHSLAILIYQIIFHRHPLEGGARYDDNDADNQSHLEFGERALFIEHPTDKRNRVNIKWLDAEDKFWGNPEESPMSIAGPYLEQLFLKSFVDGLHNSELRPSAEEWRIALEQTQRNLQSCGNIRCQFKWHIISDYGMTHESQFQE